MSSFDPEQPARHAQTVALDVLLASIYCLMTRYARRQDRNVSRAIAEHLLMLAAREDLDSTVLRCAGRRLAAQWNEHIAAESRSSLAQTLTDPRVKIH
jgi:hypothetical protein